MRYNFNIEQVLEELDQGRIHYAIALYVRACIICVHQGEVIFQGRAEP